jgi:hypothetical protein
VGFTNVFSVLRSFVSYTCKQIMTLFFIPKHNAVCQNILLTFNTSMSNNNTPASVPNPMAAPGPSSSPPSPAAQDSESSKPAAGPAATTAAKPPTPQQQALQQQIQAQLQAQLQQQLQAAAAKGKQANITPEMIQVGSARYNPLISITWLLCLICF